MSINLKSSQAVIREKRLKSIVGYKGSIKDLTNKAQSGCIKNSLRGFTQATNCSSGCAQGHLSSILDAAIVNHAPIGCVSEIAGANASFRWGQSIRNWERKNVQIINTNMSEGATVFGGSKILREGVRKAFKRFNPKVIFVTTSCASGIIGDDIDSITGELEEELGIPIVPVYCEGFRSQIWASGFDAAFHALLTRVIKPPKESHPEIVNVIQFNGSGRDEVTRIFGKLGLVPRFGIPYSTIGQIEKMSEAGATISVCGTLGGYLGNGLQQKYGVPYVTALQPHGIFGVNDWLTKLGSVLGKEKEVEKLIKEETERILPELAEIREKLKGKKVVVGMGPSFSHNYIRLLQEYGMDVVWGISWHYDAQHDHGGCPNCSKYLAGEDQDIPVSVGDQQNHEVLNLLSKVKPDLFIGRHPGMSVWATKMGIPTVMVSDEYSAFGYNGTISFGYRLIDAIANNNLARNLSKKIKLPYTDWWFEQEPFHFLEQEEGKKTDSLA
ncbi:MAG: nitrogenase component 1 [Bacillota bacterium]|nr:nitrogenase component 1 [Bacillota bacterium]